MGGRGGREFCRPAQGGRFGGVNRDRFPRRPQPAECGNNDQGTGTASSVLYRGSFCARRYRVFQIAQAADERADSPWEWILGVGFLAALLGLALGVWLFHRSDRQFEKQALRPQYEVNPKESLDKMGIEASDGPDFSGLDEQDV